MRSVAGPEVTEVRPGEELDWASLEAYLRRHLPQASGPFSVLQFPNGSANLTYLVRFGADAVVVRRPPFGVIATGAHDMRREHTVLSRLHAAYPRAPLGLHYCADESIIGAHFLVSEYRSGVVVWDRVPEQLSVGEDPGRRIGFAVVDALADLHLVDPAACGLGDLGRPTGYLERQLGGWQRRWEAVAIEGRGTMDRVGGLLARHLPMSGRPALVHNDFKVDNCQFAPGSPDVVTSVFDWDMATLGDPLTDLGTLLNYWPDGADAGRRCPGRGERRAARARRGRRALCLEDREGPDPRRRRLVRGLRLLEDRSHHAAALRAAPSRRELRRPDDGPRRAGRSHRGPGARPRRDPGITHTPKD